MSKCYKCAELRSCYHGRAGLGKDNCKMFCPVYTEPSDSRLILERTDDYETLLDGLTGKIFAEGHQLSASEVMRVLNIDFVSVYKEE